MSGADWEMKWVIRMVVPSQVSGLTFVWHNSTSVSQDRKLAGLSFLLLNFPEFIKVNNLLGGPL
jgi:hypothetical protein